MKIIEKLYKTIVEHTPYFAEEELDTFRDISEYGADAGYPGFTMDADCHEFWDKNSELIQEFAQDTAEEFGHANWLTLFGNFQRNDVLTTPDGYKVLGAWFVLEEVANWFVEREETM